MIHQLKNVRFPTTFLFCLLGSFYISRKRTERRLRHYKIFTIWLLATTPSCKFRERRRALALVDLENMSILLLFLKNRDFSNSVIFSTIISWYSTVKCFSFPPFLPSFFISTWNHRFLSNQMDYKSLVMIILIFMFKLPYFFIHILSTFYFLMQAVLSSSCTFYTLVWIIYSKSHVPLNGERYLEFTI